MSIWPKEPLGRHAEIRARIGWRGLSSAEYTTEGPFLIAGQHIKNGRVDWDVCDHLSEERYEESPEIALRCGDVIISKDGTIGRVARIDALSSRATLNGTMMLVRPRLSLAYRFLYHFLGGHTFQKLIEDKVSGSSIPHLFQRDMVSLTVDMPPLKEQYRITVVLDRVDEAIAKTDAVITKLKQVRSGLLHDLLTRGLDEHGQIRNPITHPEQFKDAPLGRIPRAWAVRVLGDTVNQPSDLTIGPFGSNLLASDYRLEGAPVVFVRDIRESGFVWNSNIYVSQDKAEELRAHCVLAGDVLITKMGLPPCVAAVYPDTMPNGVITADVIRLRPCVDVATSFWLAAYINSPRFAVCVRKITGGVTRPKVTLADFRKQLVLLPSVEEQQRIENIVRAMIHGIEEAEADSRKLLMLKSGLMSDLLTGRVRVPEGIAVAP